MGSSETVVKPGPGRVDGVALRATLDGVRVGEGRLVVDLSDVGSLDSSALSALIGTNRAVLAAGGEGVVLRGVGPVVLELLTMTGLHRIFRVEAREPAVRVEPAPPEPSVEGPRPLRLELPAVPELISAVVELSRLFVAHAGVASPDELDRLDVVLSEAVTNAIVHGSPRGAADAVAVCVEVVDGRLTVTVDDHGPGFDLSAVAAPDFEGEVVGGRGVYIMRSIMDDVTYGPAGGGCNRLVLRTSVQGRPA